MLHAASVSKPALAPADATRRPSAAHAAAAHLHRQRGAQLADDGPAPVPQLHAGQSRGARRREVDPPIRHHALRRGGLDLAAARGAGVRVGLGAPVRGRSGRRPVPGAVHESWK